MTRTELLVNGMTCSHCEQAVRAELLSVEGIVSVTVDAPSSLVTVDHTAPLSEAAVSAAIDEAGYELRSWPTQDA